MSFFKKVLKTGQEILETIARLLSILVCVVAMLAALIALSEIGDDSFFTLPPFVAGVAFLFCLGIAAIAARFAFRVGRSRKVDSLETGEAKVPSPPKAPKTGQETLGPIWRKFERTIAILVFGIFAVLVVLLIPGLSPFLGLVGIVATLWAAYKYGLKGDFTPKD